MLPTLSDVVQAELPAEPVWDGRSFLPQLRGQTGNPREFVFCYYAPRHGNNQTVTRFARDKRWKLYGGNTLFDVVVDPQELHPIDAESLDADGRASRTRLQAALEQMEDKPQAR
jgi:arylsulfatase A